MRVLEEDQAPSRAVVVQTDLAEVLEVPALARPEELILLELRVLEFAVASALETAVVAESLVPIH